MTYNTDMKPEIMFLTIEPTTRILAYGIWEIESTKIKVNQDVHIVSYLVVLQIPTLDLFVLSAGEQIRASTTDCHPAHRADVPSQGEFQFPTGQVPDLPGQTEDTSLQ